jgi:hypothetical protein
MSQYGLADLNAAVQAVTDGLSVRAAAEQFNVSHQTQRLRHSSRLWSITHGKSQLKVFFSLLSVLEITLFSGCLRLK